MNIFFISRTYPPGDIGGMEKQNYQIYERLRMNNKVVPPIKFNKRLRKIMLPVFFVKMLIKSLFFLPQCDIVLLGDGVLGIIGYILKIFSKKPVVCIVHGLDLTYPNYIYQELWVKLFIRNLDKLIAVGNETIKAGVLRGIPEEKFVFVGNGVSVESKTKPKVLLTLGRLIKRKGVVWFIQNVFGKLSENVIYLIAGEGREEQNITAAIKEYKFEDRVFYLGRVPDKVKKYLFCSADIFVQPNIAVEGDIEGFGIVVLEAASYGLPVIASDIEGLRDAIQNSKNGILVKEGDAEKFKQEIERLLSDDEHRKQFGLRAKQYVEQHCSWEDVLKQYVNVLQDVLQKTKK